MSASLDGNPVNKFIALEGIDGVGKSTIAEGLAARLRSKGHAVHVFRGLCPPFEELRHEIKAVESVFSRYLFYLASNAAISHAVEARLAHEWVICDRYIHSTQAYHVAQGLKNPIRLEETGIRFPDHAFWVALDDEQVRRKRLGMRGALSSDDLLERTGGSLLDRVETIYREYGLPRIDNSAPLWDTAIEQILRLVLAG
jgi:dTMP kinase